MYIKIIIMFIFVFSLLSFVTAHGHHGESHILFATANDLNQGGKHKVAEKGMGVPALLPKADQLKQAEKYEEAKNLYSEVLKIEPNNQVALQGKADCRLMLEPIIPVQHLMVPAGYDDTEYKMLTKQYQAAKTPWDKRRAEIAMDRFALKYTGRAYSADVPRWEKRADRIVARAISKVKVGLPPGYVYRQTKRDLESLQEKAHRGWKGHGPEILEPALLKLKKLYQENSSPLLD